MTIAIASDHEGFELKRELLRAFQKKNVLFLDLGTHDERPVDYPDFAEAVGLAIRDGRADRGILLCGSGVGACCAANKMPWVRAGICHDTYSAHQGVEHDNMNVLVIGARIIAIELAEEIVSSFLPAVFSGEERHKRRLRKIASIEHRYKS